MQNHSGNFTGILFRNQFLWIYWTNHSEILHNYCLDLSEGLILCSGPKNLEFREKTPELQFFPQFSGRSGILVISVNLCTNNNGYALISLL